MRKTYELAKLKATVNAQILNLADEHVAAREAVASILETVLHDAGAYQGFQYLDSNDMKASKHGTTVGINDQNAAGDDLGSSDDCYNKWFKNTDRTRVKYF